MRVACASAFVSIAVLLQVLPAAGQRLDIEGEYGNEEGCRYLQSGSSGGAEGMLVLNADGLDGYATGCEFVQVLSAKNGSKIVTGLCAYEGEEGRGARLLVIEKSLTDTSAFRIYTEYGELWDEVRPCS